MAPPLSAVTFVRADGASPPTRHSLGLPARRTELCPHLSSPGAEHSVRRAVCSIGAGEGMSVLGITCLDCWDICQERPAGLRVPFVGTKLWPGRGKSWRYAR